MIFLWTKPSLCKYCTARAISNNWLCTLARWVVNIMDGAHKFASPDIVVLLQILCEIGVVHVLEDQAHRMAKCGVDPDERNETIILELTVGYDLCAEPLSADSWSAGRTTWMIQAHLPCMWVSNRRMRRYGSV